MTMFSIAAIFVTVALCLSFVFVTSLQDPSYPSQFRSGPIFLDSEPVSNVRNVPESKETLDSLQHDTDSGSRDETLEEEESSSSSSSSRERRSQDTFSFGHKRVGPLSRFQEGSVPGSKWVGYFYEQSMALVLLSKEQTMLNCILLELKKEEEQQRAFQTFGPIMELVPIPLRRQIQLNRFCGQLPPNYLEPGLTKASYRENRAEMSGETGSFTTPTGLIILPGTMWCGIGDRAQTYNQLGESTDIDKCCRTHDNCPMKVSALKTRYGVTNYSFQTRSHCLCEEELYQCLKETQSSIGNMSGNLYFNFLDLKCLQKDDQKESLEYGREADHLVDPIDHLYQCQKWNRDSRCMLWRKKRVKQSYKLVPFPKSY